MKMNLNTYLINIKELNTFINLIDTYRSPYTLPDNNQDLVQLMYLELNTDTPYLALFYYIKWKTYHKL